MKEIYLALAIPQAINGRETAYIGIDPGLSGAIGVIYVNEMGVKIATVDDVPLINGKYDFYKMWKFLGSIVNAYDYPYLTLEAQQSMPGQGVSSTFKTGLGYGAWQALCTITTPDFDIVSPRKWKKKLGLTKDKEQSRSMAIDLFPVMADRLKRKKDHNRAEALLLAYYTMTERD